MKPIRIQLRRVKGWKLPPNTVVVARPSKWGNPFKIIRGSVTQADPVCVVATYRTWLRTDNIIAGGGWDDYKPTTTEIRRELRGKNLACWCPLADSDGKKVPCHSDVLLEIANRKVRP